MKNSVFKQVYCRLKAAPLRGSSLLFLGIAWLLPSLALGQANTTLASIQGVLVEKDKETNSEVALPGVSVLIVGTTKGANTDLQGSFTINQVAVGNAPVTLRFTYVGYKTITKEVTLKPGVNNLGKIYLVQDLAVLDEAVVTAFGVAKEKRDLGYSVQTLKGDEILKAREPNPIQGLTGKIAGLNIGTNAEMLSQPNVLLRGKSGVMYVVDGVPINSDSWNIPSDDIETYTVLKGPNAAALYGFRGQNGAILITTKSGSKSKKGYHVEVNSSFQVNSGFLTAPIFQTEYGNGNNYRYAYGNHPLDLDGRHRRDAIWGPRFEGQPVRQYDSPVDPVTGEREGTPWVARGENNWDEFTRTGYLSVNNVSVGSSNGETDFRMSLTNTQQSGVFPNTGMQINNFHLSGGHRLTNRFKVRALVNANFQDSDNIPDAFYGPQSYLYDFGVYGSAAYDLRDLEDYWLIPGVQQKNREYGRTNNPWFIANEWLRGHRKRDMYGYVYATYDINPYSNILARTQFTMWDGTRTERMPYSAENYGRPDRAGDYMEDKRDLFESNIDLLYTYKRDLGDFHVDALLGTTVRNFSYNSSWTRTNNLIVPGVYNFTNSANPPLNYNFASNMLVLSAYSSIDVSYKNYIRLNATGHWDQLSTLPPEDNSYFYPSASVSTIVTDYLRNSIPNFISFMKLRGSVAEVQGGLVNTMSGPAYTQLAVGRPFSYGGDWWTVYDGPSYQNQNTYGTRLVYNNLPGASFTNIIANPDLKPFNVRAYETGLDVMFLENRLGLDFTFFRTLDGPQIFVRDVAPSSGFFQTNINDVVTRKDGFEVALTGTPILKKDFRWNVLVNYASFVERFHEINDPSGSVFLNGNFYSVGDRVDEAFGIAYVRDQQGEVIHGADGMPLRRPSGPVGNTSLGFGNNDFAWAINNKFTYKNWGFSFQVDGRVGGAIFNELRWAQFRGGSHPELAGDTEYGQARRREWESFKEDGNITPGYVSQGVRLVDGTIRYDDNGNITNWDELTFEQNDVPVQLQPYIIHISGFAEPWVQSKTYTMLREVVLTYSLPLKKLKNSRIEGVYVSLVGRNLAYFAAFKEMNMDQYPGNQLRPGVGGIRDSNNTRLQSPTTRSFGINLNVKF